jgi:hypothetical protein
MKMYCKNFFIWRLLPGITFEAAKKGLRGAPGNEAEDGGEAWMAEDLQR